MPRTERQRWRAPDGTIARLIEAGLELYLLCRKPGCGHRGRLTIDDLRVRFPSPLEVNWIVRHARCSRCDARWPDIESRRKEPKVGTLGDLIALRHDWHLFCENRHCRHHADMPVAVMAERYGIDYTIMGLMLAARCGLCGTRWPDFECHAMPIDTAGRF